MRLAYKIPHKVTLRMVGPQFVGAPGVSSTWFLLDGEYLPVAIMTMGDGKANVMRRDL